MVKRTFYESTESAWGPATLLKRDSNTDVFLWNS